jgi:D-proline reductase (dithiol) PrdB
MGHLDEFALPLRTFLKAYPWRRIDPVPWAPLRKPLSECRLALVSSAALVLPEQVPLDGKIQGGDVSFREIPGDVDPRQLVDAHKSGSYDHSGVRQDANLAFPLDRMRELVGSGRVGSLAGTHLSFMGSIIQPGRLIRETAPRAAELLVRDSVDIALLVPV